MGEWYEVVLAPCRPASRMMGAMRACLDADLVFCWFGSTRFLPVAALARALGKPVLIVAGGYDVASVPEIAYGNMLPGLQRVLGRLLFRLASGVVPYSTSAAREALENAGVRSDRLRLIYLGFDGERFGADVPPEAKEPFVLTVAGIDECTIHRKGLLAVAEVSRLLPDVRFVMVGSAEPEAVARLRAVAGPNVEFPGFLGEAELAELYRSAKVYLQPAVHEAFGCSIAEAMLYDCTPVVTRCFSLPEVVGPCGHYVEADDYAAMAATVQRALAEPPPGPESPRARILRAFPESRRRVELIALLEEFLA